MKNEDQDTKIIVIASGSFQGKSIIALEVAARFEFSGVITTDTVRNVLKILNPDRDYLSTSTYLLSETLLLKQMEEVSSVVKEMIAIYRKRGEHVVIEGMHFSNDFLRWTESQNFHKVFINNRLPLRERVLYKHTTRSRLRLYDPISSKRTLGRVMKLMWTTVAI
jgi:2-phosphoglycerate kinase